MDYYETGNPPWPNIVAGREILRFLSLFKIIYISESAIKGHNKNDSTTISTSFLHTKITHSIQICTKRSGSIDFTDAQ